MASVSEISSHSKSTEYEMSDETLDTIYANQVELLRELIFKQTQNKDIALCCKWLETFSETSRTEKIARNCLCGLMHQQLREYGYLGEPFTDSKNCTQSLEQILFQLDTKNMGETNNGNFSELESSEIQVAEGADTNGSYHGPEFPYPPNKENFEERHDIDTKTENVQLRRDLEAMRLELTEKQIENLKLKEFVDDCREQFTSYENSIANFKKVALNGVNKSMLEFENDIQEYSFKIFETVFSDFNEDVDFINDIKIVDRKFQLLIKQRFYLELSDRKKKIGRYVYQKFVKIKNKMRQKFEQQLKVQTLAQNLQLKLVELKCYAVLRQVCIKVQSGGESNMMDALKELEDKYQKIISEIS